MEKHRVALVLGGGGLKGAYCAGVVATLGRELGPKYFSAVYASSVGVYAGTFYVAGQPDTIEKTWKNPELENNLINYSNLLHKEPILNVEYLTKIFKSKESRLDIGKVFNSNTKLTYCLTDNSSLSPEYKSPTQENIFKLMEASSSVVGLHGPVDINGVEYIDGALSDPLPVKRALEDGYGNVVAVSNEVEMKYTNTLTKKVLAELSKILPRLKVSRIISNYEKHKKDLEDLVKEDSRIKIIKPASELSLESPLDRNHKRVGGAFNRGVKDARAFLLKLREA